MSVRGSGNEALVDSRLPLQMHNDKGLKVRRTAERVSRTGEAAERESE